MEKELEEAKAEIERLRIDCNEKLKKREEENRHLLLSLDEVIERDREKQQELDALTKEAERFKAHVSLLEKKCAELERAAESPADLDDQKRKADEELKYKGGQFEQLEKAYQKLQDQFSGSRSGWDMEKSSLLDEISKLRQSHDDDGSQSVEDLQDQLETCKRALDHEENHRKRLEVEISEAKLLLESRSGRDGEEKSEMECSTAQLRMEEIEENLRHSLHAKEKELKEMERRVNELETENQELLLAIKELQEAQTHKAVNPAQLTKVRSRLKALEQTHKECSDNLKAREVEWSSQAQDLRIKDQVIQELRQELESCHSSLTELKLHNEELSLMSQLGRSEVPEAQSAQQNKDQGSEFAQLMEQLTLKNIALAKAQTDLRKEHEEKLVIQRELDRCKEMLEESSDCQLELMEQAAEIERKLTEELQEVFDALERLESELTDKTNEGTELEYELQSWQSVTDRLKKQFDESVTMRRGLEQSLMAQVEVEEMLRREIEEKDRRISNLEQQILLFDQEIRILEEREENNMVKTRRVQEEVQPAGDDSKVHQNLPANKLEKISKQSSPHAQKSRNIEVSKQRSERVENPEKKDVPSTHDLGDTKNDMKTLRVQEEVQPTSDDSKAHQELPTNKLEKIGKQSSPRAQKSRNMEVGKQRSEHVESLEKKDVPSTHALAHTKIDMVKTLRVQEETQPTSDDSKAHQDLPTNKLGKISKQSSPHTQKSRNMEVGKRRLEHVENLEKKDVPSTHALGHDKNDMVKTLMVQEEVQLTGDDSKAHQELPANKLGKISKQSSPNAQKSRNIEMGKQRSEHAENPEKKDVPSTHALGHIKNPRNVENLQETNVLKEQSSQSIEDLQQGESHRKIGALTKQSPRHTENSCDTEVSSQNGEESKSEATSTEGSRCLEQNEIASEGKLKKNGSLQPKSTTDKQSSHHLNHESEGTRKQCSLGVETDQKVENVTKHGSEHKESPHKVEVASRSNSPQLDHESESTSKQCSVRVEANQNVEDPSKRGLEHKESPQQAKVAHNEGTHQDNRQSEVASKPCPQRDGNDQKITDSCKQALEQSRSHLQNKVTNNQSSKQVNQQSEASKQCSQRIESAKKTEVSSKQTPQQSKGFAQSKIASKQSIFQSIQQQTEEANKRNPPEKKRSTGKVLNMAQAFESGKTRVEVEGEICVTKENLKQQSCSRTNEDRSPFRDLNEDIFKKKATVAI